MVVEPREIIEPRGGGRRPAHSARAWSRKIQVIFYAAIIAAIVLVAMTFSVIRSELQAGSALPQAQPSIGQSGAQSSPAPTAAPSVPPSVPLKPSPTATKAAEPKPSPTATKAAEPKPSPATVRPSSRPTATTQVSPAAPRIIGLTDYQQTQQNYDGDQVVYYFDASWCPTCRAAVADFNRHKDQIPADLVIVLADFDNTKDLQRRWGVTSQSTAVSVTSTGAKDRAFWAGNLRDVLSQA